MGSRRRHWKTLLPQPTDPRLPTPVVLAPVSNVGNLIDLCAGISLINYTSIIKGDPLTSRLKALSVFTLKQDHKWRSQCFVAFLSSSGRLPTVFRDCPIYTVGSDYHFSTVKALPPQRHIIIDLSSGVAGESEALNRAVIAASESIHEDIDPVSESFKDAVSSRLAFFKRQTQLTYTTQCKPSPPPPTRIFNPRSVYETPKAFKKPSFKTIDELLCAFATHAIDASGVGKPLHPTEPSCGEVQALVFCPPMHSK